MSLIDQVARRLLTDIAAFSQVIIGLPLRQYQVEPLQAVIESVLGRQGLEFLLVFPRQSGKNEAVAQLLVFLLNVLQRLGGNIVMAAQGDAVGMAMSRLEERLTNRWNAGKWERVANPRRRSLGKAAVLFLSTSPLASARGQTAHWLLVVDETQDQDGPHMEAVFTPMRAAHNATALYIGTVKLTTDYLWTKKAELEAEERQDGIKRVFMVSPEQVIAENPSYKAFLETQVRKHGRNHPIVASEYFLEPIDGSGGLFDPRRRALMKGSHTRRREPEPGHLYVATLDVAGEDEAPTDAVAQLANPARDYTVATVFEVQQAGQLPAYHALDVFVDHGSKHFQEERQGDRETERDGDRLSASPRLTLTTSPRPCLASRLAAWLEHWHVAHLVADESGVGLGLVSWLKTALGDHRVTGYNFAAPTAKAALGSAFVALIETGRFKYFQEEDTEAERHGDRETERHGDGLSASPCLTLTASPRPPLTLSDSWWFFAQAAACAYEIPPEGSFEKHLRWGVPASHKTPTPAGPQPTHDDRLISAALVAELDRLNRAGKINLGIAKSAVTPYRDPLGGQVY